MNPSLRTSDFFKAGGTLHPGDPSYITRQADDELYRRVMEGQFCYVLTSRQRGKSSLMIRTAERLRRQGVLTAIIDLSGLGTQVTREQWYLGIIKRLTVDLKLSIVPEQWWHEHRSLGSVQSFTDFLHDMVLEQTTNRIVIFLDEIDSTLKLDFTDDFFAAIRVLYNLRATNPEYDRLTFVLLGVAAPTDLIKDRNRTPFNIGYAVDLQEFNREDVQPLEAGLERVYPTRGAAILNRIFYWTNGHPYLTQKLCLEIVEAESGEWQDHQVDQLVAKLFLSVDARKENNLQFVRSSIEASQERRQLLRLYQQIYNGDRITEDNRSVLQNRLRLIGLVRSNQGILGVCNEIYRRVFNRVWIKQQMPINWTQHITIATLAISLVALVLVFWTLETQADRRRVADISEMARLCRSTRDGAHLVARKRFFESKSIDQQLELFRKLNIAESGADLPVVIQCLAPAIDQWQAVPEQRRELMDAMCSALSRADPQKVDQLPACRTSTGGANEQ